MLLATSRILLTDADLEVAADRADALGLGLWAEPCAFRFAQRRFGASPWEVVLPEEDYRFGSKHWDVVGQMVHVDGLDPRALRELFALLRLSRATRDDPAPDESTWDPSAHEPGARRTQTPAEEARERELLSHLDRSCYVPPLDVDVDSHADVYKSESADHWRGLALDYARRLGEVARDHGLGLPYWFMTGARGSMHGDALAPAEVRSPWLVRAYGRLVCRAARAAGVPLLSDLHHVRAKREKCVFLDDSLFNRSPDSRGGLWRPPHASKRGGYRKTPWDVDADRPVEVDRRLGYELQRCDREALAREAEAIARDQGRLDDGVLGSEVRGRAAGVPKLAPDGTFEPPTAEDLAAVDESPGLTKLWHAADGGVQLDRSRRDWHFAQRALERGLQDASIVRLLAAMPGSKTGTRDLRYAQGTIASARRRVEARRLGLEDDPDEGRLRGPARDVAERAAEEAARLAGGPNAASRSLREAAHCGELGRVKVCPKCKEQNGRVRYSCDRAACPRCTRKLASAARAYVAQVWGRIPEVQAAARADEFGNHFHAMRIVCPKEWPPEKLKKMVDDCLGAGSLAACRWFITPGFIYLLAINRPRHEDRRTDIKVASQWAAWIQIGNLDKEFKDAGLDHRKVVIDGYPQDRVTLMSEPFDNVVRDIGRIVQWRHDWLAAYVARGDWEGLARDPWAGKVRTTSCGRQANLPWRSRALDMRKACQAALLEATGRTKPEVEATPCIGCSLPVWPSAWLYYSEVCATGENLTKLIHGRDLVSQPDDYAAALAAYYELRRHPELHRRE